MSGLKNILSEMFNTSKNTYLNEITTYQLGLPQGHLNSSHTFESMKTVALNDLLVFRSFTNADLLLSGSLQQRNLFSYSSVLSKTEKKYLNKSNVAFSLPKSSHYMFLIFPKKNSSLFSPPQPSKTCIQPNAFLLRQKRSLNMCHYRFNFLQ